MSKTPKQILAAHLASDHGNHVSVKATNLDRRTYGALQKLHGNLHHRFRCNHIHAGENYGPDNRPPGWKTGEGAIAR